MALIPDLMYVVLYHIVIDRHGVCVWTYLGTHPRLSGTRFGPAHPLRSWVARPALCMFAVCGWRLTAGGRNLTYLLLGRLQVQRPAQGRARRVRVSRAINQRQTAVAHAAACGRRADRVPASVSVIAVPARRVPHGPSHIRCPAPRSIGLDAVHRSRCGRPGRALSIVNRLRSRYTNTVHGTARHAPPSSLEVARRRRRGPSSLRSRGSS